MRVRYTEIGLAQAREQIKWWRDHCEQCPRRAFDDLEATLRRISRMPKMHKPYGRLDGELVWRTLSNSARLHVFYTIDEAEDVAYVEYVWGATRGSPPPRLDE